MMTQEGQRISNCNYRKWMAFVGAVMIFFPLHLVNVWGNLSVYLTSYLYAEYGVTSTSSPWPLSAFAIGKNTGAIVSGYIPKVGRKTIIFVGLLLFNIGFASIYFIVVNGMAIMLFIDMGILGFCCGITDSSVFKILCETSGSSRGLYMSAACSGFNFGSLCINLLIGFYMNPSNLPPDVHVSGMSLFSATELTSRLPSLIIIMGIAYPLCMLTGYALLCIGASKPRPTSSDDIAYGSISRDGDSIPNSQEAKNETNMRSLNSEGDLEHAENNNNNSNFVATVASNGNGDADRNTHTNDDNERDYTVWYNDISFYVIFFSFGCGLFPYILVTNMYKTFGLVHIKDDHLLTKLGSTIDFIAGTSRICWGFVLDKVSIKHCMLILYTVTSLSVLLMYFAAFTNKYFYFVVTLFASSGTYTYLTTFLMVIILYFGDANFSKYYGLLCLSRVFFAFVVSLLFEASRNQIGWFGPFLSTAFAIAISLVMTIVFVPDVQSQKKKDNSN